MPMWSPGLLGRGEPPRGWCHPALCPVSRSPWPPTSSRVGAVPPSLGLAWKHLSTDGRATGQPGGQLGLEPWRGRP